MRNRIIPQTEALYVGPSPSTGFSFINDLGILNNSYVAEEGNYNLLKSINRVQNVSYGYDVNYASVKSISKQGFITRSVINNPNISLNFDYLQVGVLNELRMGFICNYDENGRPYYSNNYNVDFLSGIRSRDLTQPTITPYWPLPMRDKRNIYVVTGPDAEDIMTTSFSENHPKNAQLAVWGFGDCYITSYATRGAVGTFPTCSVSYTCDNLVIYASGSGCQVPSLNSQTKTAINKHFNIPSLYQGNKIPPALLPGDITLNIESTPKLTNVLAVYGTGTATNTTNTDIKNIGLNFTDLAVQSYELGINLDRKDLMAIGYKLPVDRVVRNPVLANLGLSVIVRDTQTGRLDTLLRENDDYNLSIKIRNPNLNSYTYVPGTAVQYDLRRAKYAGVNYSNSIGNLKTATMNFNVDLDSSDFSKGLFVSGLINVDISGDYLLTQNTPFYFLLSNADDDKIRTKWITWVPY